MEANHLLVINTPQILMLKLEQIHLLFINNVMLIRGWGRTFLLFITCLFQMIAFTFCSVETSPVFIVLLHDYSFY